VIAYRIDGRGLTYAEIQRLLRKIAEGSRDKVRTKKQKYINLPCALDIESTSTTVNGEKVAYMYLWTFAIGEHIIIQGRTWPEWQTAMEMLAACMVDDEYNLLIYVHNLEFEFQFMRGYVEITEVLTANRRQVIVAKTSLGIEFRCSYKLSGKGLASLAGDVKSMSIKKLTGNLDYSKVRHARTKLTRREYAYALNDVLIIVGYIRDCIGREGHINKIPLTATGYTRRHFREACLYGRHQSYRKKVHACNLTIETYTLMREEFGGGFGHASGLNVMHTHTDVQSWDENSAYPTMCLAYKFPASDFFPEVNPQKYDYHLHRHACLFRVRMTNVQPLIIAEHPLSESHCRHLKKATVDNGRIVAADYLETTLNEVDLQVIKRYYSADIEMFDFHYAYKRYLPREFVETLLELYEAKTKLKGVQGREEDYMIAKGKFNAAYGMMVEAVIKDDMQYINGEWVEIDIDAEEAITDYNKSPKRFLYYAWGCWVTAYARRALLHVIAQLDDAHIYGDTDSSKCKEGHEDVFINYNRYITKQLYRICDYYGIDRKRLAPETAAGVKKPLGVFEHEADYREFKTLGAKRYMYIDKSGKLHTVISGVNKKMGAEWFKSKAEQLGTSPFDLFDDDLIIPYEGCGRLTHTYIDTPASGYIVDYRGKRGRYDARSSSHLSNGQYTLNLLDSYIDYIHDLQEGYYNVNS
jgi:hypothetical protein